MKMMKKWLFLVMAFVLAFNMQIFAFGADYKSGFSDVSSDAWYRNAVAYVQENGLMIGTSTTTFSPDNSTSREMLATVLYRMAGSPMVSTSANFQDVAENSWYTAAVNWAAANGVAIGYDNGTFGVGDPVSREQIATIFWRYAGSPIMNRSQDYSDERAISAYASDAVDWARANRIMIGKGGNRFDPQGNATRAEVATILMNYMQENPPASDPTPDGSRTLVVYFSASGNTGRVAGYIAEATNADILELIPVEPYSDADLDWTTEGSRVNREHDDESLRDIELVANTVPDWDSYDTVFIGYPIWWGIAAWPVNGFIEANDFTGKNVIPFCTSASSGLGESGELLAEAAGTGNWLEGQRFSSRPSEEEVQSWVDGLGLQ